MRQGFYYQEITAWQGKICCCCCMLKSSTPGFNCCKLRCPAQIPALLQHYGIKLFLKVCKNNIQHNSNLFNQLKRIKLKPPGLQKGRMTDKTVHPELLLSLRRWCFNQVQIKRMFPKKIHVLLHYLPLTSTWFISREHVVMQYIYQHKHSLFCSCSIQEIRSVLFLKEISLDYVQEQQVLLSTFSFNHKHKEMDDFCSDESNRHSACFERPQVFQADANWRCHHPPYLRCLFKFEYGEKIYGGLIVNSR